jgi:hypothetical protein
MVHPNDDSIRRNDRETLLAYSVVLFCSPWEIFKGSTEPETSTTPANTQAPSLRDDITDEYENGMWNSA